MIGIFLINAKNEVCFVHTDDRKISNLMYMQEARIITAFFDDNSEEMFIDEIASEIHAALLSNTSILIVKKDANGDVESEYDVPLKK